eukprot:gene35027-58001_t
MSQRYYPLAEMLPLCEMEFCGRMIPAPKSPQVFLEL